MDSKTIFFLVIMAIEFAVIVTYMKKYGKATRQRNKYKTELIQVRGY